MTITRYNVDTSITNRCETFRLGPMTIVSTRVEYNIAGIYLDIIMLYTLGSLEYPLYTYTIYNNNNNDNNIITKRRRRWSTCRCNPCTRIEPSPPEVSQRSIVRRHISCVRYMGTSILCIVMV